MRDAALWFGLAASGVVVYAVWKSSHGAVTGAGATNVTVQAQPDQTAAMLASVANTGGGSAAIATVAPSTALSDVLASIRAAVGLPAAAVLTPAELSGIPVAPVTPLFPVSDPGAVPVPAMTLAIPVMADPMPFVEVPAAAVPAVPALAPVYEAAAQPVYEPTREAPVTIQQLIAAPLVASAPAGTAPVQRVEPPLIPGSAPNVTPRGEVITGPVAQVPVAGTPVVLPVAAYTVPFAVPYDSDQGGAYDVENGVWYAPRPAGD